MAGHNHTGKTGEQMAIEYLRMQGFSILHTNWRYSHYEIDIIASKNNMLHFIEVKTRRNTTFGYPEESVSKKKIKNLLNGADEYLHQNPGWKKVQYDVLSISMLKNQPIEYFFIEDVYL